MLKRICDICETNEANMLFKIKVKDISYKDNHKNKYQKLNIYNRCYNKLVDLCGKLEDDVCEYYVTYRTDEDKPVRSVCFGTKNVSECYCGGSTEYCTYYVEKRCESR